MRLDSMNVSELHLHHVKTEERYYPDEPGFAGFHGSTCGSKIPE